MERQPAFFRRQHTQLHTDELCLSCQHTRAEPAFCLTCSISSKLRKSLTFLALSAGVLFTLLLPHGLFLCLAHPIGLFLSFRVCFPLSLQQ